ncbi:hypothetical protein F5Y18DRAFT_249773 [Xylariaceae sp. FL1019]|nr:hypothetical protein F5Y18DRAFT_249773 [Xylariaceae sp. FL1019]
MLSSSYIPCILLFAPFLYITTLTSLLYRGDLVDWCSCGHLEFQLIVILSCQQHSAIGIQEKISVILCFMISLISVLSTIEGDQQVPLFPIFFMPSPILLLFLAIRISTCSCVCLE